DMATSARSILRALGRSEESLGPDPALTVSTNGSRMSADSLLRLADNIFFSVTEEHPNSSWEEIEQLANRMADHVFVSRNLEKLKARGVDMLFHPGTHDFVAFDVAWCGKTYPQIPIYLRANTGHGKKGHPAMERDEQNKSAFLLRHFFEGVEPLLESPAVSYAVKGTKLLVTVQFKPGSGETSGRIFWMFDRGPDGSAAYINEMIPDDQWKDMKHDAQKKVWTVEIELKKGAAHIDFFSNHGKTVTYRSKDYRTYISSPYTRAPINGPNARQKGNDHAVGPVEVCLWRPVHMRCRPPTTAGIVVGDQLPRSQRLPMCTAARRAGRLHTPRGQRPHTCEAHGVPPVLEPA
ncbi:hypothetical protein HQ560_16250, partial [bacterium]|nr:hypothetical protein [bacterium]